jgi:hypothetical protein
MGHFATLCIKENISIEQLQHDRVDNIAAFLEEEFIDKYCSCLGDSEPSIRDITDFCGTKGNTFDATAGIKCPYDQKNENKYMIVNLKDITDDYLQIIQDRVYSIAINRVRGRKHIDEYLYFDDDVQACLNKIKRREINGIAILMDCHD